MASNSWSVQVTGMADSQVGLKGAEAICVAGGQLDIIAGGGEFPRDRYGHIRSCSQ